MYKTENAKSWHQYTYLLRLLVIRNIKNQYYRSFLGVLWTVLNPLLTMAVMAFVFSSIFGRSTSGLDYPVYVLSGSIVFGLMRTATSTALPCFVSQRGMLQKTRVPLVIFPTSQAFSSLVSFLFSCIALIVVMLVRIPFGVSFHWEMIMCILIVPALMLFSLGLGYFLSALYVFFRDIKHIHSVFILLWTYLTPIFYGESILDESVRTFLKFNPMYYYVTSFRELLMGVIPNWTEWLIMYAMGIVIFALGALFLHAVKRKIVANL